MYTLGKPQLSCAVEALAGTFRLKTFLQVIPCGLPNLPIGNPAKKANARLGGCVIR